MYRLIVDQKLLVVDWVVVENVDERRFIYRYIYVRHIVAISCCVIKYTFVGVGNRISIVDQKVFSK